jgi:hypothetical protein
MRQDDGPALDGLRQEKFNMNLLTDWIFLLLKSARGISQSTALLWRKYSGVSNLNFPPERGSATRRRFANQLFPVDGCVEKKPVMAAAHGDALQKILCAFRLGGCYKM